MLQFLGALDGGFSSDEAFRTGKTRIYGRHMCGANGLYIEGEGERERESNFHTWGYQLESGPCYVCRFSTPSSLASDIEVVTLFSFEASGPLPI